MDNAGWHAKRRANREDERWSNTQRGPDGMYQPVEQLYPMPMPGIPQPYGQQPEEHFIGGFGGMPPGGARPHTQSHSPAPPDLSGLHIGGPQQPPPPVPTKDYSYDHMHASSSYQPSYHSSDASSHTGVQHPQGMRPQWSQSSHDEPVVPEAYLYATQRLTNMNPVERTQHLRAGTMDPMLQLMCGPLLRYDTVENGIWYGAAMIVTVDANSVYDPYPCLAYFYDPDAPASSSAPSMSRPRAPSAARPNGAGHSLDLWPHPTDPMSNVRLPETSAAQGSPEPGPRARTEYVTGQEIWVYCGAQGTYTFWRFLIHVPLGPQEMRVKYTINRGQELEFVVPGRTQNMRFAAYSCNGFSAGVDEEAFRGPSFQSGYDPLWIDLLEKHEQEPFHALIGGGDQLYCDGIVREPELRAWVTTKGPNKRKNYELTPEMRFAIDRYYFTHYCKQFRSGAFARANSSIPMVNMLDDHDLIDGFGSYPDDLMKSAVFGTIGARGYFFFLLFQCFINVDVDGTDVRRHPFRSLVLGGMGPYVQCHSHSFLTYLGPKVYMLLLDCRAERQKDQVCSPIEYDTVFARLRQLPQDVDHLVVQLGIPIAYPRMVFLENWLESKFNPVTALSKAGTIGLTSFVNKFNADAELLDDLNDHWTAKSHKTERNWFIEQLQALAQGKYMRITFLSGDVHCAAVGVLKTRIKGRKNEMPPDQDFRYMLNVVTSAIVNTPPPNGVLTMVSTLSTKTHRTLHHLDTDETMVPIFDKDTNGGAPRSKYVMGARNWCSVKWSPSTGDLVFDIRVEKKKGWGETVGYAIKAPPPRWTR